jgi:hypothetical protein
VAHDNLKKHSRLKAYIDKISNTDNGLTPNEWNSFVDQLDYALGGKKQCMSCEKTVDYSSGVFTCEDCSK